MAFSRAEELQESEGGLSVGAGIREDLHFPLLKRCLKDLNQCVPQAGEALLRL